MLNTPLLAGPFAGAGYPVGTTGVSANYGNIHVQDASFTGAASGLKFAVVGGGSSITLSSGGVDTFPGNQPGFCNAGGEYTYKDVNNTNGTYVTMKATTFIQSYEKVGAPVAADMSVGCAGIFKDTGGGSVVLAYNDGGTIKTVALP